MASGAITRTLEPGVTYFSAAEIRIVLLPIGEMPDDVFQRYASLVMAHRQVELSNVRSFYKESQKSPFKFFPWKTGNMHFRFLPDNSPAAATSPLSPLHSHRKVLGVIGLLSCEHTTDITRKYKEFEQRCRAFPEATTVRCLAFNPAVSTAGGEEESPGATSPLPGEDARSCPDLIIFPPTTKILSDTGTGVLEEDDHLINHMEVVMHDFAACVLASLESWMLTASPAMISLSTLTDTSEFTGVAIPPYSAEDDAGRTKRKYARLQKSMGDYSLLAGSPLDAVDHYNTAVELGRAGLDFTIAAAAIEGYAAAKLLHAAVSNDAFVMNAASVFRDESAWRSPRNSIGITNSSDAVTEGDTERKRTSSSSMPSARSPVESVPPRTPGEETASGEHTSTTTSSLKGEELRTSSSIPSSKSIENDKERENFATSAVPDPHSSQVTEQVFDGLQFWDALRRSTGLEEEIRGLVEEAKGFIRKRGGLPLLVEADLRWARLLAGLHGCNARSEATDLANEVQLVAEMLPLPEDRLIALTESAGILGTVGAGRKRVLLMWQAVELSKYFGFPDARTLAVAWSALEPATRHDQEYPLMLSSRGSNNCGEIASVASSARNISSSRYSGVVNDDWDLSRQRPLDQETTIPASWAPVRAGCLEATLGLAIYAKRHSDVFDAAAALLRGHPIELSTHRMQSLLDNLVAAASQMAISEKARPGKGPPPLLYVVGPRAVPDALAPLWIQPLGNDEGINNTNSTLTNSMGSGNFAAQSPSSRQNVFLYDPFSAKRQKERNELRKKKGFASMDGLNSGGVAGIASRAGGNGGGVEALLGEIDSGIQWVSGEPAMVDIEVANPSSVSIKIDKMVLEAKFIPLASNNTSTSDDSGHTAAGNSEAPPLPSSSLPHTSNIPITATKSIWKGKPVSLNIPAYTKPVRIQLEGTPLVPGILILTGCRLTAFGGVSWSQPWTGKALNLAKKLAEASSKKLFLGKEGISVAKSDSGGSSGDQALAADTLATNHAVVEAMIPMKGPAVTILPTLPRLKLELHSASAAAAAADGLSGGAAGIYKEHEAMSSKVPNRSSSSPITLLKLMHGQSVMPHLVITNNGAVAIDTLRIGIGDVNTTAADLHKNKYGGSSKPLSVDVDTSTLKSLLPLQPGQSISLPVLCRALGGRFNPSAGAGAPVRSGGGGEMPTSALAEQQQQPCVETIDVEYASSSTQTPGTSSSAPFNSPTMGATTEIPGRRAMLEIAIAVAPSLHVSQIEFAEVYQQQQQLETHNNQGCTTSCERRVLMLADVVNRGSTVLEAWLGPSSGSTNSTISTTSTIDSNGGTGNDNIETEEKNQNHVVVLAPGQRAALSYLVNKEDVAPLIATTAADGRDDLDWNTYVLNNAKFRGGRNTVVLRYEEREKQMCASFLAERIGLHFNTYIEKTKSSNSGGGNGGGGGIEEQSSTAVIDDTATIMSGSLPLIHGEIYNGITPSVLCMLRSCAISLRFSIAPLDVGTGEQNAIATTTTEETDDSTTSVTIPAANNATNLTDPVPPGNLLSFSNSNSNSDSGSLLVLPSALRASLGQPLKVTMEVESNVDEAVEVFCSFMCTPVPTPVVPPVGAVGTMNSAGGGGGGGGASGVVDPSPRDAVGGGVDSSLSLNSLGGVYSPAPVAAGVGLGVGGLNGTATAGLPAAAVAAAAATWVGIHSRLQISVPARKKITHVAGVTIVAPGRYRVGAGHVSVTYPEASSTEGACFSSPKTSEDGVWHNNNNPNKPQNYAYTPGYYPPTAQGGYPQQPAGYPQQQTGYPQPQQQGYPGSYQQQPPPQHYYTGQQPPPNYYYPNNTGGANNNTRPSGSSGMTPGRAGLLGAGGGFLGGMLVGNMMYGGYGGGGYGENGGGGDTFIDNSNTYIDNTGDGGAMDMGMDDFGGGDFGGGFGE